MCLALPMKVKEVKEEKVLASIEDVEYEVNIGLLEDIEKGDYIIVHAGFAIQKLDEKEAQEKLQAWEEVTGTKEG